MLILFSLAGGVYFIYIFLSNCSPTGPVYNYYYYVEIISNSTSEYQVKVPFPMFDKTMLFDSHEKHNEDYINNLERVKGDCSFDVIDYNGMKYLNINGITNSTIRTSIAIGFYHNLSLISKGSNETLIYSNSPEISIILEYRQWMPEPFDETHSPDNYYSYSAVLGNDDQYPSITNETWGDRLSMEYALKLNQGKHSYPVIEGLERNPLSLVIGRASLTHPEENG